MTVTDTVYASCGCPTEARRYVCPQSGEVESAAYFAEYGVPGPSHITVLPSPMTHVALCGIAVAVTDTPGTVAVFDTGFHIARSSHIHVGTRTS
ncbi:hypothetical protein ACWD4N_22640 [Streptomyces sp. NPDC002586]